MTLPRSLLVLVLLAVSAVSTARSVDGPAAAAAACAAGPTTLCLNNQRFRLDVQWRDFQGNTGAGRAVALTSDTGYFWFFSSSNVELVVKVLDGRGFNGHFWVFFGALSNVEYTLHVTDTATGSVVDYANPSGQFASVGDTSAFTGGVAARPSQRRVETTAPALPRAWAAAALGETPTETPRRSSSEEATAASGRCVATATSLCLNGGRFRVESAWRDFAGNTGVGTGFRAGIPVVTQLDASRAVSRAIPTAGGSISATAADGTVFTLTVPPDALRSEETIRMTPVTAIGGLPLSGGLSAAVDLEPQGLRLMKPATLTIAPSVPITLADEVTFAWRGSGEELFLFPPELSTPTIAMKLMHFSGYGVGRGTAADQAALQAHPPGSSEDALSQRIQDLYAKRRKGLLSARPAGVAAAAAPADDAEFFRRLGDELQAYYDTIIGPGLHTRRSCANASAFFSKAISWARSADLTGFGGRFADETQSIQAAWIDAMVDCYDESFDKCVQNNEPTRVVKLLSMLHQLAVVGADHRVDANKVQRCARFELDFESVIDELAPQGSAFKWRHQVHAVVPITFSLAGMKGNADLAYTSVTYTGPPVDPCVQTSVGSPSVFQVLDLGLDINEFEGDAPPPYTLSMDYDPGYPNFTFTLTCPLTVPVVFTQERWRSEYYDHHHSGEAHGSGFRIDDWERVGGRIFARRTYQQTFPFADEVTILTLKHTPQ